MISSSLWWISKVQSDIADANRVSFIRTWGQPKSQSEAAIFRAFQLHFRNFGCPASVIIILVVICRHSRTFVEFRTYLHAQLQHAHATVTLWFLKDVVLNLYKDLFEQ